MMSPELCAGLSFASYSCAMRQVIVFFPLAFSQKENEAQEKKVVCLGHGPCVGLVSLPLRDISLLS